MMTASLPLITDGLKRDGSSIHVDAEAVIMYVQVCLQLECGFFPLFRRVPSKPRGSGSDRAKLFWPAAAIDAVETQGPDSLLCVYGSCTAAEVLLGMLVLVMQVAKARVVLELDLRACEALAPGQVHSNVLAIVG